MEDIEYKGYNISISDYSVIVTHNGSYMGQFDTESEARDYIDSIYVADPVDPEFYTRPTARDLEASTGLKIVPYYGLLYIEVSGKDPADVEYIINDYNKRHNSFVSCYYDRNKDCVLIKL